MMTNTSIHTDDEADDDHELHQAILLRDFLAGTITAGEELFEISSSQIVNSMEMWIDVLSVVLKSQSDSRLLELACGISANLVLKELALEGTISLVEHMLELLCSNTAISDPYIISEILRVFTNISYKSKGYLLLNSIELLSQYAMYLAENSLSPRVLAQLFQFLYYFQLYSSDSIERLYKTWNANTFFQYILCNDKVYTIDTSTIDTSINSYKIKNKEINIALLQSLQEEKLGTNNGFEWFLYCLDHTTTLALSYPIVFSLVQEDYLIIICIELFLSTITTTTSYYNRTIHQCSSKLPNISLQTNEVFLLLSILESIARSYELHSGTGSSTVGSGMPVDSKTSVPCFPGIILKIVGKYNHSQQKGVKVLLLALLEYGEEAVLMKDEYAIISIAYLIHTIYNTSNSSSSSSSKDLIDSDIQLTNLLVTPSNSAILLRIRTLVEVLELDLSKHWLAENIERKSMVVSMLQVLLHILRCNHTSTSCNHTTTYTGSRETMVVNKDKLVETTLNLINTFT